MKNTVSDILNCLANLSSDEVFTSPELANQMLDMLPQDIFSDPNAKFLDPCSKSGVFLREIAKRLMVGLEEQIPDLQQRIDHIMGKQLFGIALTQLTAEMSRRTLYCAKNAAGKYSVANCFENEQGNVRYMRCEHIWANGKCSQCGANRAQYDRAETIENYAYPFIHKNLNEIFNNMQFDVIIGNPPYQMSDGGNSASAMPIYHLFVEQAKKINPRYLCMIMPSRWFAGGKGLDEFRRIMLNDKHIRFLKDYVNAKDCFPETSIGGGVCYFLRQNDYEGECQFVSVFNGKESEMTRSLNEFDIFVRHNMALDIIHKIDADEQRISSLILSRNPFGLPSSARGESDHNNNSYALHSSKGVGFVDWENYYSNKEYADSYKVMISKVINEHAGEPDKNGQVKLLSSLKVLSPKEICTDSYLIIGKYETKKHAENLSKYLATKFARFLLLQAVTSINLSKDKFQFVPLQDFSHPWTDEMLYEKYGLTEEEINFIESMIKPME